MSKSNKVSGFSLVEVLIAVVVLAIGMLGIAGLLVTSKRANLEAVQRSSATALAQDLAERMRANPFELASYTNGGTGTTLTGTTIPARSCATGCTPEQLAQHDLFAFERNLVGMAERAGTNNVGGLIAPMACLTGPNGGTGTYTFAVVWRGLTKLSDPGASACGRGSGLYDASSAGTTEADVHRRVLVLATLIAEPL
ncbi:MAG: type IV pilus modification protein PilV [Gammaproteobacteria bacterium]|nr:type IV pilus modification protein PilV [Gammaproteobacteria bacterium]